MIETIPVAESYDAPDDSIRTPVLLTNRWFCKMKKIHEAERYTIIVDAGDDGVIDGAKVIFAPTVTENIEVNIFSDSEESRNFYRYNQETGRMELIEQEGMNTFITLFDV